MFDLDNITVEFPPGSSDAVRVLDRITFAVEPGEYVAVVGPNGCGKSTLLQCIAGLVPFVAGRRRVGLPGGGETPVGPVQTDESSPETQAPESEAGAAAVLSLLLQEPDDHFVASRVDYELWLSIPLSMTESDGRVRVAEAIDRFSLHGLEGRNPHRLSGGEKQRLALAIAWVSDPDLLLLDEPTAYLDGEQGERCRAFVRTLNEDGVTVVWAALEANAVPDADRVVYLAEGKIRFDGTPASYQEWAPRAGTDPPVTLSETGGVAGATVAGSQMPFMKPPRVVERTRYPVVALDRVGFSYGDSGAQPAVLTDVSLEVRGGEAVGITGRNGAGKSTLLAVMSGILQPTAGRIERAYARAISGRQQNVFHMFQSPESLFFAETVAEEIAFGLRALGYAEDAIAGRIDDALERFEMDPARYRERSPFHLSFGEMRRVAFAIAEVLEPRFLLLDEPTSCLDRDGWALLAGLIGRVNDRGGAVVLASHDPVVIDALTHRSVSLDR